MKAHHLLTLVLAIGLYTSCSKATSKVSKTSTNPIDTTSKPKDTLTYLQTSSLTFFFNGDTAYSTAFTDIDSGWNTFGPAYPELQMIGYVKVPATRDSMYFVMWMMDVKHDLFSINQFMGAWNDTSHENHASSLELNSQVNANAYYDVPGNQDFYMNITANNGRTLKGTFYGVLATEANNTGAPPTMAVTKGVFSVNLY
jgi:hypothetical protein